MAAHVAFGAVFVAGFFGRAPLVGPLGEHCWNTAGVVNTVLSFGLEDRSMAGPTKNVRISPIRIGVLLATSTHTM